MSTFFKSIVDAINLTNVTNVSNMLNKYSKHIAAIILVAIIYQLYLATFMRENFDSASSSSSSSDKSKGKNKDNLVDTVTSCTQFTSCTDCVKGQVNNTDSGCFWNPTCEKCGSFKDKGYFSTCDAKKDPNVKCSPDSDPRPIPQTSSDDNNDPSDPAPYDDSMLNSGLGIPLPYNDFDGAKSVAEGAADSENGCPVCPKLTLLKGPTYTMEEV